TNMGLVIKEIKIYDKPYTDSDLGFHFNTEYSPKPEGLFWANETLYSFSKEEEGRSACVLVLLTAKVFADGILGLANIGNLAPRMGLCANEPQENQYLNTAIVTVKKMEGLMITRIFDLVFAHELGHLWGSGHDYDGCVAENFTGGRFIMHPNSNTGYDSTNYRFSNCSINSIFKVLRIIQPDCFVEEQKSLCGNGILEPGEECDAGGRYADGEDVNKCDYLPKEHVCVKKNDDTCRSEAYCTGIGPHCPEPPNAVDGTTCNDEGTCRDGNCISFCAMKNPNHMPCICENSSDSCYRCCRDGGEGKCEAVSPRMSLRDGSICILGYCKNKVCEKEVTDTATHYWKLIRNINNTPGSKLFGDYAVFLIVFISLIVWIPCSICVYRRDKKLTEEHSMAEAPIEYVHGLRKIHRQNATEHPETTDGNHVSTA
ncbi:hypothetical protein FO519_007901, partial [Halicephalobus sp. NKZ332]